MGEFKDLTGLKFEDWEVIKQGDYKLQGNGKNQPKSKIRTWTCQCTCGFCKDIIRDVNEKNLVSGKSKSCGTKSRILNGKNNKKYNKYDLDTHNYGICYTDEGIEFYFDKEDYDKLKDIYWREHKDTVNGYARGYSHIDKNNINKFIFMHNVIMEKDSNDGFVIDHIDGETHNNRKYNLRLCTKQENSMNQKIKSNNTSGKTGVHYSERENMWKAYITYNKKRVHLGTFTNKENAVKARLKAEDIYFRDFKRGE